MENNEFVEKKNGKKIILIVLISIFIVLLGVVGFYFYFTKKASDPRNYLTEQTSFLTGVVDDFFTKLDRYEVKTEGSELKTVNHITFKTDSKELDLLNDYNFDLNLISSLEKEEMQLYLNLKENEKQVLDGTFYVNKDSVYVNSSDLYNKMIQLTKLDENPFLVGKELGESYTTEEVHTIFNNLIKYFFEAMKESDLKGEVVDFYKIKYTYEITSENQEKVQAKFDDLVKKDKKLQALLKENANVKSEFSVSFAPCKIEVTTHLLTNTILKVLIKDSESELEIIKDEKEKGKYLIKEGEDTSYLYIKDDKVILEIYENKQLTNTFEIVNKDAELSLTITDPSFQFSFSLKETAQDTMNVSCQLNDKGSDENMVIDLKGTIKKISNGYDSNLLMDIEVGEEKVSSTIKSNTVMGDNLLTETDYSNFVALENLSENEVTSIIQNLMKKLENTKILDLLTQNMDL